MGNADANKQFFAEERRRLVRAICDAIAGTGSKSLRTVDVLAKVREAAAQFEKETYDDDDERQR